MRILFDTSVLVAAMVRTHPAHAVAVTWLQKSKSGTHTGLVAAHSLAELYAVLTTLPVQPRISPAIAHRLIRHNVFNVLEIVPLSGEDYRAVLERLTNQEIAGGVVYDALILQVALKAQADRVMTLNEKDFRRIYPDLADRIVSPS